MKIPYFILLLLLFPLYYSFPAGEQGSPERNYPYYDKYRVLGQNDYVDFGHGIFETSRLNHNSYGRRYLYYNEYYNTDIQPQNRSNENIEIAFTGYDEKPEYANQVKTENAVFYDGAFKITILSERFDKRQTRVFVECLFDENTHRLILMKSTAWFSSDFQSINCNEYSFDYHEDGKLDGIYAVYDGGRILRKKYYYDGQPRRLYRPYFIGEDITGLEEIVVYDGAIPKYVTKLYSGKRGVARLSMEDAERNHHFTVSEYDEKLRILRIVAYYEGSDLYAQRNEPVKTLYLREGYSDLPIEFSN
ncbi:MAG: hypothetical protein LBK13_05920 [Spirochaetales bacterium]|jgi:hypothetical protein|nr:hypothetical protein [Spirochaetales bacterium]